MTTFYRLKVYYYQYNDGSSNNGHFNRYIDFETEESARKVAEKITKAIATDKSSVGFPESDEELPDYIPGCCGGYYTKPPELFGVTSEKIK